MLRAKIILFLIWMAFPVFAQPPLPPPPATPTLIPPNTPVPVYETISGTVPKNEIYTFLATAVYEVNSLPNEINASFLPSESGTQIISYAKWMFSGNTMRELMGETLSPIGINLYILLALFVGLVVIYFTVRIGVLIIRFVIFIVTWVLKVIPFIG